MNKKLLLAALGVALLIGVAALAYLARAWPRSEVAETLHDFGSVSEAQPLTHTFLMSPH